MRFIPAAVHSQPEDEIITAKRTQSRSMSELLRGYMGGEDGAIFYFCPQKHTEEYPPNVLTSLDPFQQGRS